MTVVLLTILVVAVAMGAMAVGVALTGKRLKGSCGGEGSSDCHCERTGVPIEQRACTRFQASSGGAHRKR
jgi:hypothetical protein